MKIRLSDLPLTGANITSELPLENLNARMNEAKGNDIVFLKAPVIDIRLRPEKGAIELTGLIQSQYRQPCSRCLEEVETDISTNLQVTLKAKPSRPGVDRLTTSTEWADGIGIVYYDGEHIDLEDIIQESLILGLSPFGPEHPSCKGPPALEGEKEEKPTLGDLLKRAGIH